MPVMLRRSSAPGETWDAWAAIGTLVPELDPARRLEGLPRLLEEAFDAVAPDWLALGRSLAEGGDAVLAHAPTAAANVSDLGLMLAWSRLVAGWAMGGRRVLVVCPDPWLFRHLAALPGVEAGPPPPLAAAEAWLASRGLLARLRVGLRMARAALAFRRSMPPPGKVWLLVYGHPASTPEGDDAYFGSLMREMPELHRVLHVDCGPDQARRLGEGGRTVSLHGFGSPWTALALWRRRWRTRPGGPLAWLIRRAAALEGGTGGPAMIAWQIHCQERFLAAAKPYRVAWPWEHHSWERAFVRACRRQGVATLGYQHATVGWREWNQGPDSDPAGTAGLPDRILCVGEAYRERLVGYHVPEDVVGVAGALRYAAGRMPRFDPAAPVFVALPFDSALAAEIVDALRPLARKGWRFLVKDHPMTPYAFAPEPGLERSAVRLSDLEGVAAVVYCATTVGLEAVLVGLPTVRFLPAERPVLDVMPAGLTVPAATATDLEAVLAAAAPGPVLERSRVFAAPDPAIWREALFG
ncbi:MAG: hypothetical protein H7841_00520 [Magnetospirillum sp. WYHS-4]